MKVFIYDYSCELHQMSEIYRIDKVLYQLTVIHHQLFVIRIVIIMPHAFSCKYHTTYFYIEFCHIPNYVFIMRYDCKLHQKKSAKVQHIVGDFDPCQRVFQKYIFM